MKTKSDARLERLAASALFAGLDRRQLARIAALSDEITVNAGESLCREDTPAHEAFVLLAGTAVASVGERVVLVLGPGDVCGEISLLEGRPRVATVTAADEVSALVLTRRELMAVLEAIPAVAARVYEMVGLQKRELVQAA